MDTTVDLFLAIVRAKAFPIMVCDENTNFGSDDDQSWMFEYGGFQILEYGFKFVGYNEGYNLVVKFPDGRLYHYEDNAGSNKGFFLEMVELREVQKTFKEYVPVLPMVN